MGDVVGVGTDLVDTSRLAAALRRRPAMKSRIFSADELEVLAAGQSTAARDRSAAGRFAAKEAVMKALGVGLGAVSLRDIEIVGGRGSAPTVRLSGRAAELAAELETDEVVISMTHEGDLASAVAIASRRCGCAQS